MWYNKASLARSIIFERVCLNTRVLICHPALRSGVCGRYMGGNLFSMLTAYSKLPDEEIAQIHPDHTQASIQSLLERSRRTPMLPQKVFPHMSAR